MARAIGEMLIAKVIDNVSDYAVIEDQCERAYGEHLNGFIRMTIKADWKEGVSP